MSCAHAKRLEWRGSLGSGRPSIFGGCEVGLAVGDHSVPARSGEGTLDIGQGEQSSNTSARFPGGFRQEDIISKLFGFERLSSLLKGERGISKLTLRPEAGDVVEVKMCGDGPFRLIVVTGGNRDLTDGFGRAEPLPRSFQLLSAKSRPRAPALRVLCAPPLRGEDPDRGLGDTELGDSSRSGERSDITSAGCERYGFG